MTNGTVKLGPLVHKMGFVKTEVPMTVVFESNSGSKIHFAEIDILETSEVAQIK